MPRTSYTINEPSANYSSGLLQKVRSTTNGLNRVAPRPLNTVNIASSSSQNVAPRSTRPSKKTKLFSPVLSAIAEDLMVSPSSPTASNSPSPSSRYARLSSSSTSHEQKIDAIERIYLSALLACDFLRDHDYEHYIKYKKIMEPYLISELTFTRKISEMMTKLADKHNNFFSCCAFFFNSSKQSKTLTDGIINAFLKIEYLLDEDAEEFGIAISAVIKTREAAFNLDECLLEKKEIINTAAAEKSASSHI